VFYYVQKYIKELNGLNNISNKLFVKIKVNGLEKIKNIDVDKLKITSTYINRTNKVLNILEA
jgi:hypothetical protein